MSSSTGDPYCPAGQASQAVVFENGFKVGFAMKVPGEQHPKRPVDPVDEENARGQHNVCVKPLFKNTLIKKYKRTCRVIIHTYMYTYINHNKWPQWGREIRLTVLHICYRPRIPFGNVLIERRCTQKHCKRSRVQQRKTNPPQTTNRYRVKK